MGVPIQILIPNVIESADKVYLRGIYSKSSRDGSVIIYFTKFSTECIKEAKRKKTEEKYIFGYYNTIINKSNKSSYLEFKNNLKTLRTIVLENAVIDQPNSNCTIILYDYGAIQNSENLTLSPHNDIFSKLHKLIQKECNNNFTEHELSQVLCKPKWLSSTMFGQHMLNYVDLINWLQSCIKRDGKISIQEGNLILAIVMDVILGYFMLQIFAQNKDYLRGSLMGALDMLVKYLFSLLEWLMGAPAGLKLNNAFNKMLGKFFSYHIKLWWIFIEVSGEKLDTILDTFHCLGYLGFTFQAALVSDLICVATFHSYCIYVYVARLFNIQISGLIALMRLFVGRKYNPLRKSIDSCEYTNQELFVGTVAFTILLFLLPTSTMYYIVFTLFRLLSLTIQYFLTKIIYWIQTLPLYVTILWIIKSPKIAGEVSIDVVNDQESKPLILKVNINTKPLGTLLSNSRPPVTAQSPIEWSNLLSNLFRGKQIT